MTDTKAEAAPKKKPAAKKKAAGKKKPAAKKKAAAKKKPAVKKKAAAKKKVAKKNPPGSDRRQHPRAELKLLVQHRYEDVDAFVKEVATNISVGGLFLRTEQPHDEGSTIYLRFTLVDGLPLIEGIGKVERVAGMGIEFISLDDESRELIESIVTERYTSAEA
jgi:uncharacterized protein (TIGR02266 family)